MHCIMLISEGYGNLIALLIGFGLFPWEGIITISFAAEY